MKDINNKNILIIFLGVISLVLLFLNPYTTISIVGGGLFLICCITYEPDVEIKQHITELVLSGFIFVIFLLLSLDKNNDLPNIWWICGISTSFFVFKIIVFIKDLLEEDKDHE